MNALNFRSFNDFRRFRPNTHFPKKAQMRQGKHAEALFSPLLRLDVQIDWSLPQDVVDGDLMRWRFPRTALTLMFAFLVAA